MNALRKFSRCQAGATAIEFAIVSLIMILVSLGIIEFGRGFYVRNELAYAVDKGARKALNDSNISSTDLESEVRSAFSAGNQDQLQVTIGSETVNGVAFRTIAVSYPFNPLVPGLDISLSLSVSRRIPVISTT